MLKNNINKIIFINYIFLFIINILRLTYINNIIIIFNTATIWSKQLLINITISLSTGDINALS